MSGRGGWTIVEVLLVVVVVTILIALAGPTFQQARFASRDAVSLTNLRSHAQVMTMYSDDYRGLMPYVTSPNGLTVLRAGDFALLANYWSAHIVWNIALADQYYDGSFRSRVFFPPGFSETNWDGSGTPNFYTPYLYSCVFLARPEYWDPMTRTGRAQWGPTHVSDVVFPSAKMLLLEGYPAFALAPQSGHRPHPALASVDGAVRRIPRGRIMAGYANGDGPEAEAEGGHSHNIWPLHTLNGARGRDIP